MKNQKGKVPDVLSAVVLIINATVFIMSLSIGIDIVWVLVLLNVCLCFNTYSLYYTAFRNRVKIAGITILVSIMFWYSGGIGSLVLSNEYDLINVKAFNDVYFTSIFLVFVSITWATALNNIFPNGKFGENSRALVESGDELID